jgi:antitoxin component YwqK of YwqJK toxin-antitoxin module
MAMTREEIREAIAPYVQAVDDGSGLGPDLSALVVGFLTNTTSTGTWVDERPEGLHYDSYESPYHPPENWRYPSVRYINGSKHGVETHYHLNGRVYWIRRWNHGTLHGEYTEYHPSNGGVYETRTYVNGHTEGPVLHFFLDGTLAQRMYLKQGKRDGTFELFDSETGKLVDFSHYAAGLKHGLATVYARETGLPIRQTPWKHGRIDGVLRMYYENTTQLLAEETYVEGVRHGPQREWHSNGKKSYSCTRDKGLVHGTVREWWSNGRLKRIAHYDHDQRTGIEQSWDVDGHLMYTESYANGVAHGKWITYYSNGGGPEHIRVYDQNELVERKEYSPAGVLLVRRMLSNDAVTQSIKWDGKHRYPKSLLKRKGGGWDEYEFDPTTGKPIALNVYDHNQGPVYSTPIHTGPTPRKRRKTGSLEFLVNE